MTQIVIRHYAQPGHRRALLVGMGMTLIGLLFAAHQISAWLAAHPEAVRGLQASLLAGLATGLGAIPVLFLRRPRESWMAPLLGLAGGMMLAASLFSLLVPAVRIVGGSVDLPWLGALTVFALIAGAALMQHVDQRTRHTHVETLRVDQAMPGLGLVVAAIALHNLPEGLAVGVASAAGEDHGMSIGIAIQNIPEGWIVASALLLSGLSAGRAALLALATGLMEPVGGLIGVLATTLAGAALPMALAAAAGAMLWVVSHELIPASHRPGQETRGTAGLVVGFAIMTGLTTVV